LTLVSIWNSLCYSFSVNSAARASKVVLLLAITCVCLCYSECWFAILFLGASRRTELGDLSRLRCMLDPLFRPRTEVLRFYLCCLNEPWLPLVKLVLDAFTSNCWSAAPALFEPKEAFSALIWLPARLVDTLMGDWMRGLICDFIFLIYYSLFYSLRR